MYFVFVLVWFVLFFLTDTLSLSVRDSNSTRNDNVIVKHYKIRKTPDGKKYFIAQRSPFDTLPQLIEHYQRELFYNSFAL